MGDAYEWLVNGKGSAMKYVEGQRVKVEYEGTVTGSTDKVVGVRDDTEGVCHLHHYSLDGPVKITPILPEVKAGQVWEADGERWFARASYLSDCTQRLLVPATMAAKLALGPEGFFLQYPDAKLILDVEVTDD